MDTVDELDWCLDQLETVQTHRSVSDMASLKVGCCFVALEESFSDTYSLILVQTNAEQRTVTFERVKQIGQSNFRIHMLYFFG